MELNRGRFQVTFDLHNVENIRGIRWNLLSDTFCEVKVEVLDCGCHGELIPFGTVSYTHLDVYKRQG